MPSFPVGVILLPRIIGVLYFETNSQPAPERLVAKGGQSFGTNLAYFQYINMFVFGRVLVGFGFGFEVKIKTSVAFEHGLIWQFPTIFETCPGL